MKKVAIIVLFFSLFAAGYAYAERVTTVALEKINGIAYLPNEKEPFTGKYEDYYPNGKKKFEANYKDGKQSGLTKSWIEDGESFESIFIDGKRNGLTILRFKNGKKKLIQNYKDGEMNGLEIGYSEDGREIFRTNYKDGKEIQETNTAIQEIISRCRKQMGEYGSAMVKACVDQDIEAENELRKY